MNKRYEKKKISIYEHTFKKDHESQQIWLMPSH